MEDARALSGPLHDPEATKIIDRALSLTLPPGSERFNQLRRAALCPGPPLFDYPDLLGTVNGVLEGDVLSGHQLRSVLMEYSTDEPPFPTLLDQVLLGGEPPAYFRNPIRLPDRKTCLLDRRKLEGLATAALLIATDDRDAGQLLRGVEMGLCGLGRRYRLISVAQDALLTGNADYLIGALGGWTGDCGPDDGPAGPDWPIPDVPVPECDPPFEDIPEVCLPPLDCLRDLAGQLDIGTTTRIRYRITAVENDGNCAGASIIIRGQNFGDRPGRVCFGSSTSGPLLPDGGRCVPADEWSDTEIRVRLPEGTTAGYLTLSILEKTITVCGKLRQVYRNGNSAEFTGGGVALRAYLSSNCVAPGEAFSVNYSVVPEDAAVTIRVANQFGNIFQTFHPRGGTGQVTYRPLDLYGPYELTVIVTARGECGTVRKELTVEVNYAPRLTITGLEVTQGIQRYNPAGAPNNNTLTTVANKDTIVRVYVDCDRGGFFRDEAEVTGTLYCNGRTLTPINGQIANVDGTHSGGDPFITARPAAQINRADTNHTLNFRLPAALCTGRQSIQVRVFAEDACGQAVRASTTQIHSWTNQPAARVRFVRIRDTRAPGGFQIPSVAQARQTVVRAFDLLPSPVTDIAPARVPVHTTSRNFTGDSGEHQDLLDDIDNLHDCDFLDWLGSLFGGDCPGGEDEYWIGLTRTWHRGRGQRPGKSSISAVQIADNQADVLRIKSAHELGHNLNRRHVNSPTSNNIRNATNLSNGGVLTDIPFDPFWNTALIGQIEDMMSYGNVRWVSAIKWERLVNYIDNNPRP